MPAEPTPVGRFTRTFECVTDAPCANAITRSEDHFVVEATLVAEKLGLSPDEFWREMQRGIVYGVVERGEDADAGRTRLTFRCRSRSCTLTLEDVTP